jgi:hypothetical protein
MKRSSTTSGEQDAKKSKTDTDAPTYVSSNSFEPESKEQTEHMNDWHRPPCPKITAKHTPLSFQIVDIDMYDGKPLPVNPALDNATGLPKERPGMTQANATVSKTQQKRDNKYFL